MEGSVALPRPPVQGGGVLDDEVHHVEGRAGLLGDGMVQARFRELLHMHNWVQIDSDGKGNVRIGQNRFK